MSIILRISFLSMQIAVDYQMYRSRVAICSGTGTIFVIYRHNLENFGDSTDAVRKQLDLLYQSLPPPEDLHHCPREPVVIFSDGSPATDDRCGRPRIFPVVRSSISTPHPRPALFKKPRENRRDDGCRDRKQKREESGSKDRLPLVNCNHSCPFDYYNKNSSSLKSNKFLKSRQSL